MFGATTIAVLLTLLAQFCQIACADTSATKVESKSDQQIFQEIRELLKEYYPKAKLLADDHKMHFEYKGHILENTYTNRQELAPDSGGVVGDLVVKPGRFNGSGKVPREENQYYYMVLLLAPYCEESDKNLNTALRYAPDTPLDFVDCFKKIVSKFATTSISQSAESVAAEAKNANLNQQVAPTAQKINPKHRIFLFKATRGKEVVYLLGTVHVATANLYPLPTEIDNAFDQSKQLVVEVAIDRRKIDPVAVQQLVKASGTYVASDRLSKHLSEETRAVFEKYLAWAGESWSMYEPYKPWYVAEMVEASVPRRGDILKIKGGLGIDRYLLGRAKAQSKPVSELETVDFQISLTSKLASDVQDKLLQKELLDYQSGPDEIKLLLDAWKDGDTEKMSECTNRTVTEHPGLAPFNKMLLDQRNGPMAEKIEILCKNSAGPLFVAVGSAHLLGDTGLVSALQKRGYSVEQMNSSSTVLPVPVSSTATTKLAFVQQGFKVWMPSQPEQSFSTAAPRITTYKLLDENEGGACLVSYFELPSDRSKWNVPGPLMLDQALSAIIQDTHGVDPEWHSKMLGDVPCREVVFTIKTSPTESGTSPQARKTNSDATPANCLLDTVHRLHIANQTVRINSYLYGNRFYLIMTCGTKNWASGATATKFMNSLEFIN
jgi:uncharacterized protein YbaP (TraB family)